ncbi:hypothetical protein FQZ97_899270 [compost metagenome]
MAEHFIDPARAEVRRTGVDDVTRELTEVLAKSARAGLPFDRLGEALAFDDAMNLHRSKQAQYVRSSGEKASRKAEAIRDWLSDLLAVLVVREALGADTVADAAAAGNKTLAASAMDLVAREKLTSAGAADLPVLAAGRGLMVLQSAGVDAAELDLSDLELLVALAGMEIVPAVLPGYGLGADALAFRVGSSLVKVDQQGATLYREANVQGGRAVLPHSVLAAASKQAAQELQAQVDERLARTPHQFAEHSVGNSSLDAARRRVHGGGLNAYANTLQ